jgi:peptidoglycan glycosyltransferase
VLAGDDSSLFVNRVVDLLGNNSPKGGSVTLTVDPAAQKAAFDGLKALGSDAKGAVVALEPSTGKVLAMASVPTYDPNRLASHDFSKVGKTKQRLENAKARPLDNRAIEDVYPPGSTFKLVTAAAALSSGKFKPGTVIPGGPSLDLPQTTKNLVNEAGLPCGSRISVTQALMFSCNVAFGYMGLKVGADDLRNQASKFGFGRTYFHDLDDALTRQAVSRFPENPDPPQTAFSAIGQFDVAATPLQMAMVAAGIANGGHVMKPYVVDEQESPDLDVIGKTTPQELPGGPAVSPSVARDLTEMMVAVVQGGTGRTAQIPGVTVAGKTGTAQHGANNPPYAWFVSFAPAESPKVAVAVFVDDPSVPRSEISGSGLAAPIAKAVMEAVIHK